MGHCTNCGRPCPTCNAKADEFNLLSLDKNCRRLLTLCLEKIGLNNATDQSMLLDKIRPYNDRPIVIESALRTFLAMDKPPRSIPYLVAIVKNNSVKKKDFLNALPPLKEYNCGNKTGD